MAGVSFTRQAAGRIIAVVKEVEGTPNDNVGVSRGQILGSGRVFWAKLTDNDTLDDGRHKYAWEAVLPDLDGFKDYSDTDNARSGELTAGDDGIERYAIDVAEWTSDDSADASIGMVLPNGRVVRMFLDYYRDESKAVLPRYSFDSGNHGPFVCWLTKDGGSAGTKNTAATWTYTVKTIDGVTLDTEISLVRARPNGKIAYAPANSRGLAIYEGEDLILLDTYGELPSTGGC